MLHIFGTIIVIVLAITGLFQFIKTILRHSINKNNESRIYLIVPLSNEDDTEYTLRSCIYKAEWLMKPHPDRIICIDQGISHNSRKICELLCSKHEYIEIMTTDEFKEELFSIKQQHISR